MALSYSTIHLRLIYFRMSSNFDRFRISPNLFCKLKDVDLLKNRFIRPRGKRAGAKKGVKCVKLQRGINIDNLIHIVPDKSKSREKCINIGCINTQSLRNKTDLFKECVLEDNLDICMVTETWFREDDSVKRINSKPMGYNLYDTIRQNKVGGGTALLVRNNIKVDILRTGETTKFEFSEYKIKVCTVFFHILITYRPPSSSFNEFLNQFWDFIEPIINTPHRLIICGDFNIHVNKNSCPLNSKFQDFMFSHNLKNYIDFETHLSGNTLDLFITRDYDNIPFSITAGCFISDHCMIKVKIDITRPKPTYKQINFRKVKDIDVDLFRQDLLNLPLFSQDRSTLSIENLCLSFDRSLSELLDRHAPLISKSVRDSNCTPWYTDELHELKREKRRCEDKFKRFKIFTDLVSFKTLRSQYIYQCNQAKKRYFTDLIIDCGNDQRRLFGVISKLTKGDTQSVYPNDISLDLCNSFNDFL